MRKTSKTYLVQELVKRGVNYSNAYRIVYVSKGLAAKLLVQVLSELLAFKNQ